MPESYAPILLRRKAKQLRSQTGNPNIVARFELEPQTWRYLATTVLSRPFHMLIHESIVLFTCIYISLAYGILYLFFQAYPIIFQGTNSVYHFTPLQSGLAFIPIGIGACLCAFIFFTWDHYLYKHIALRSPWTSIEEYRRLPLACLGGPFLVLSLFWLGFTSSTTPALNPFIPILSGTTFGLGFLLIMMAMLNYLTDAYETYAASAQAVASCCRSVFGALLPLAAAKMFSTLGIRWACATLGFIALVVTCIPFGFVRWGERIRGGSKFCRELKKIKEREEREEESRRQREMEMEMDKQRKRDGQVVGGGDYDNNDDYDFDE
ncbi:putative polyamine transporter 3 [Phaeomoniella chlamydospora]|uniref:Putative polyamine transporter 3 n=1 Tax=Phaeomoniella chlamydospora TaxID=158046 RepID=A0A0G2GW31_PHACM|nr:putative polyamine transporter 3 [Phaeomoniella chlamydospora]